MKEKIRTILLIARPKVGKTTLLRKVVELMNLKRLRCTGFYTEDIRQDDGSGFGFDVVTIHGKRTVLARLVPEDNLERPKVGNYYIFTDDFETLALPLLKMTSNSLLIIDEIDRMKLSSTKFQERLEGLLGRTSILATTSTTYGTIELIERIKSDPTTLVIEVNKFNRKKLGDCLVERIAHMIS